MTGAGGVWRDGGRCWWCARETRTCDYGGAPICADCLKKERQRAKREPWLYRSGPPVPGAEGRWVR